MNTFKKTLLGFTLISSMFLVGCGSDTTNSQDSDIPVSSVDEILITDTGGVQDRSFNQSAWEGLEKAEADLGVEISYLESQKDGDFLPNLESAIDTNPDMIYAVGFSLAPATLEVAANYPEQQFTIIDYYVDPPVPNVSSVMFKDHESSYLVGYIAGSMTETNKVGFIGGTEGPVMDRYEYGFKAGVHDANPDAEVVVQYANSYGDQAVGKAIATTMYQSGVDIIFQACGDTGIGVIEAAKEQNKYVIGVDRDQSGLAPENVIASTLKNTGDVTYLISEQLVNGTYVGGQNMDLGLADGAVGISMTGLVEEEIQSEIYDIIIPSIIDGTIVVPSNEVEYNEFIS